MERLTADLTHSLRRLARAPGFATIAILTLALGIGANTAIFSLVKTVVLQPLPYAQPDHLVMIWGRNLDKGETTWLSVPEILSYRADLPAFEQVAAYTGTSVNITGGLEPERVMAAFVTPNLFRSLGVSALVGRTFSSSDSAAAIGSEVVISDGLWQRRFGGRADVVGQSIQLNGSARTVIGVMPPSFRLPRDFASERPTELWMPVDLTPQSSSWGDHSYIGFARVRRGTDLASATAAMEALEERWVRDGHWTDRNLSGRAAIAMSDFVVGDVRSALWVLLGAVGVILLIACANVANLILARSDDRHREVAVRTALGASRGRIVRQLLTESVVIAIIGGVLGIGIAYLGMRGLLAVRPTNLPRVEQLGLDVGVLAFSLLLTVMTGLVFGLAPAMELSKPDLNRSLKEGGRAGSVGKGRQRFRDSLAVTQMAFSVVLLIGAMLLVRSFVELRRVDLGFKPDNALTFRVVAAAQTYNDPQSVINFYRTLRQRLAQLPGVEQVGATRLLPLTGTIGDWSITIEGKDKAPGENPNGDWQVVTPGYFESMGMRVTRGRTLTDDDHENAPIVAVINETMARRYWPGNDPIGKRFHIGTANQPWITIVGIIGRVRHNAVTETERAEMYVPHAQWGAAGANPRRELTYVVRTSGDPMGVVGYVRETVRSMDPNMPIADLRTLERVADASLAQARFTTLLLALFAALALTLATIGIYGVISLLVTRRRQEIGIRMALGARPQAILTMVLRRGMTLAAIGVVAGVVGAFALTSVLNTLLYGVTRFDPTTFIVVPLILAAVALAACLIPAGRAARVAPLVALREE
jgi:putative ABC transport system permease protein